ncbi:MAG: hypothetical protein ACI8TF_003198, partial [Paracoccaceae bacterium]
GGLPQGGQLGDKRQDADQVEQDPIEQSAYQTNGQCYTDPDLNRLALCKQNSPNNHSY